MAFMKSARVTLASLAVLCLGTIAAPAANAYSPDIDGDGIPNTWELKGYDADGDGKIDVDFPALGADPNHKDIFVEMDYMAGLLPSEDELDRITKIYADEFWNKLNVCHVGLTVPYPIYRFEYTSPGGKENRAVTVTLDTPTLDALSETLERKIRWAWPEGGERTLMTAQLRQRIKERDNYTCQNPGCGNSIMRERILILEVVHKVPLSEGGNNEPDNLQTLCWRCVRGRNLRLA